VLLTSIWTTAETTRAGGLVTVLGELALNAYPQILSGGVVTRAVLVSVEVTTVGMLLSTVVSVPAAYGLSRPRSFVQRHFTKGVIFGAVKGWATAPRAGARC